MTAMQMYNLDNWQGNYTLPFVCTSLSGNLSTGQKFVSSYCTPDYALNLNLTFILLSTRQKPYLFFSSSMRHWWEQNKVLHHRQRRHVRFLPHRLSDKKWCICKYIDDVKKGKVFVSSILRGAATSKVKLKNRMRWNEMKRNEMKWNVAFPSGFPSPQIL